MKDWEVTKVNQIYKELDRLSEENAKLKSSGNVMERLQAIEVKVDKLLESCGCAGDESVKAAAKKKTK